MTEARMSPEWSINEWKKEWNISVGTVYRCLKCGYIIIVTKSGIGKLEPICCGENMEKVSNPDDLLNGSIEIKEIEDDEQ